MLSDFVAAIKRDRKLSFKNWRYRLLHWSCGINPATAADSPLPSMLYKHYCPLFHLTNLIVLFLPLVVFLRVLWFTIGAIGDAATFVNKHWPKRAEPEQTVEQRREQRRAQQLASIPRLMIDLHEIRERDNRSDWIDNFDAFYMAYDCALSELSVEEVKAAWASAVSKYKAAKLMADERKAKMKDRIVFYVNISQFIVKCLLYVIYAAIAVALVYSLVFHVGPALWDAILFLLSIDFLNVLFLTMYFLRNALFVGLAGYGLYRLTRWSGTKFFSRLMEYVAPPVEIVCEVTGSAFMGTMAAANGVLAFLAVFYADNCPAIEIVSPEDEEIEASV